jgi:cytidyltransferase-like protein
MDGHTKSKIVATSGYFNPLHKGHIRLIHEAKQLGDYLVVIMNNDKQVSLKGGKFMDENERMEIVGALKDVDEVILSIDQDRTVKKTLELVKPNIFAKGGDTKCPKDIPEADLCEELGIEMKFNIGGDKIQSSSWLKLINN